MDHDPQQPTTPLTPALGGGSLLLAVVRVVLIVPGKRDEQTPTLLTPPSGRHWKIYALLGPVLIVSGIVLHFLHDAGTGNFLVVMGVTNLASYLYMRFRALDVVDAAAEFGRVWFPG